MQIFGQKEFCRIYPAIDYLQNKDFLEVIIKNQNDFMFEILIEYIAIMTMSLSDVLAETLNEIFGFDIKDYIYLKTISNKFIKIGKKTSLNPLEFQIFVHINNKIIHSDEYKYMRAFCNTVKHKNTSDISFRISKKNDLIIREFSYENKSYSEISLDDFIAKFEVMTKNLLETLQIFIDYSHAGNPQNNEQSHSKSK